MSTPALVIIRRRPAKPKGRGGRPRKPEGHAHVAIAHARLTAPERLALDRVREKRRAAKLAGGENDSEWIREMLHEEVLSLGVEVPAGYDEARLVRSINVKGLRTPARVADEPPEEE